MSNNLHSYAISGDLKRIKELVEGGANLEESDNEFGKTALMLACLNSRFEIVAYLVEQGADVSACWHKGGLPDMLQYAYAVNGDGEYVTTRDTVKITAMLRVMVLHIDPPESLTEDLAEPLQWIVQDGARLRARLPAYLAQRRAHFVAHCPLLAPLWDLVYGYEKPTTTDELWATGLWALL
jgi:ankyrin repeat protein